jgi:hypothetical protein
LFLRKRDDNRLVARAAAVQCGEPAGRRPIEQDLLGGSGGHAQPPTSSVEIRLKHHS